MQYLTNLNRSNRFDENYFFGEFCRPRPRRRHQKPDRPKIAIDFNRVKNGLSAKNSIYNILYRRSHTNTQQDNSQTALALNFKPQTSFERDFLKVDHDFEWPGGKFALAITIIQAKLLLQIFYHTKHIDICLCVFFLRIDRFALICKLQYNTQTTRA